MNIAEDDAPLLERAATWDGSPVTPGNIAAIAAEHGLDFATALLHERIARVADNANFLREARSLIPPVKGTLIGIVPGAFYREHHCTGADGGRVLSIAKSLGIAAEVIPTASFGTLAENAATIARWIELRREENVALVSLSKGGADVKRAFTTAPAAVARVRAWVSLSGLVTGTPLIEWLHRRPLRWWAVKAMLWWRGHPRSTLDDLRHSGSHAAWPTLPPQLIAVHVCGFPLRHHLAHPWASRGYERLAPLGPNDGGGNLVADALHFPGIVCPVWGADHYLSPAWDATPLLTRIIAAALAPRHARKSATAPSAPPASKSSA